MRFYQFLSHKRKLSNRGWLMASDLKKWMSGSPVSVHIVEYCFKFDFCKTTNAPFFTVNMSSLKGTLRNYCDSLPEIHVIIYIFFPRSIGIKCSIYWKLFCPLIYDSQQCHKSKGKISFQACFYSSLQKFGTVMINVCFPDCSLLHLMGPFL